jgi:hypothetical protein
MKLAVLFSSHVSGKSSSREKGGACKDSVFYMRTPNRAKPDRSVIRRFRRSAMRFRRSAMPLLRVYFEAMLRLIV